MIESFKKKKLVEYLKSGQNVLIRFGHGLGDTIMFMPIFYKLKELYPDINFDLYVESGQEEIFESIKDKDAPGYDLVFSLNFPMSEGSGITKQEKCCRDEIGIKPVVSVAKLPQKSSPFVAVHFHGTALPNSVGCPENIAKSIWNEIADFGKIPIECHFQHTFHNPINKKFEFIDNNVRQYRANLHNLIGLIQHSFAFIGVASGPFVVSMSCMPDRTLYLEKNHPVETYTKDDIQKIRIDTYQQGDIKKWLNMLS